MSESNGVRHVFDDIEEHDNALPNWWLGILWATLFFGLGYWLYYQGFGWGPDPLSAYRAEVAEAARRNAVAQGPGAASGPGEAQGSGSSPGGGAPVNAQAILSLVTDEATQTKGKAEYARTCASCHGPDGAGLIGPNLTDKYWLHGSKPEQIRAVIAKGATEKGMPGWEQILGAERVTALSAYVLSLKGKNLSGRPPQGEPEE